jgi:hypothetical protein
MRVSTASCFEDEGRQMRYSLAKSNGRVQTSLLPNFLLLVRFQETQRNSYETFWSSMKF